LINHHVIYQGADMYKLIALDLDGTLLNSQREISIENQLAIAAAQAKGVKVVLVSGRPTEGVIKHARTLNMHSDEDYLLSYNAALIQTAKTHQVIYQQALTGKAAKTVAQLADASGLYVHAFSPQRGLMTPVHNQYTALESAVSGMMVSVGDFADLADDEPILKAMIVADPDKLLAFIKQLPASVYAQFTVMQSAPFFLEFLHKKSNKGIGVKALADHLSITADEVICIGDAGNDEHMIAYAGLGVAMGNATKEIKALAQYTTSTNNEHGVAQVIHEFVLA